jgi:hypothetical protein
MSTYKPIESEMIPVTPNSRIYLEALESYGLFEGEPGQQRLSDGVREMLHGLHQVLGGGRVALEIQSHGTNSVVEELDAALDDAQNTCGGTFADTGVHCP